MSARRCLLQLLSLACALGALAPVRADEPPAAPAGFTWVTPANNVGSFLRPDGWFTKEETHGDTRAFFITKTSLVDADSFDIGFTVNAFDHVSRKGRVPSDWARALAAKLGEGRQILKAGVIKGNAADMNVVRVLDTRRSPPVEIHYLVIGNDAADRAWLLIFEAPQAEWDKNYPIAEKMLNVFGL